MPSRDINRITLLERSMRKKVYSMINAKDQKTRKTVHSIQPELQEIFQLINQQKKLMQNKQSLDALNKEFRTKKDIIKAKINNTTLEEYSTNTFLLQNLWHDLHKIELINHT